MSCKKVAHILHKKGKEKATPQAFQIRLWGGGTHKYRKLAGFTQERLDNHIFGVVVDTLSFNGAGKLVFILVSVADSLALRACF